MTQPVQEPTQGRIDSGQEWRSHQLFRRPATAGDGGIQFGGADPIYGEHNVGEYLSIETSGADTPLGLGVFFNTLGGQFTVVSDDGINLDAPQLLSQVTESFDIRLVQAGAVFTVTSVGVGPNQITVEYQGNTTVGLQDGSTAFRTADATGNLLTQLVGDGTAQFTLYQNGSQFVITDGASNILYTLDNGPGLVGNVAGYNFKITDPGGNFQVRDSSGNTIFQIDESGALHGKTGQSLVFDL